MAISTQEDTRVEKSLRLGRVVGRDEPSQMGESTWGLLEAAIREGIDRRRRYDFWITSMRESQHRATSSSLTGRTATSRMWFTGLPARRTGVPENFGEEAYQEMFRTEEWWGLSGDRLGGFPLEMLPDVEAMVKRQAEIMRGHWPPRGAIHIVEEDDRYVMNFFPCNSGGRMLRSGMTEGKWNLAVTTKPHDLAWNKPGKPIYCGHCALGRGLMV